MHTGAIVTSGLIVAHERVIPPPLGVWYPYTGFTVTVPCAPLPAGTLLGATALVTLMVNCGTTASTVSGSGGVVNVVVGPVPVIVMLYAWVVVVLLVVMVAKASPGVVTDAGLIMQTGVSVAGCCEVTWHVKLTVTLGLEGEGSPTAIAEEATPLGATASGSSAAAVSVNSDVPWAAAGVQANAANKQAAHRHETANRPSPVADFTLDSDHSDLNMNGFWFN